MPKISSRTVIQGVNDFATLHAAAAAQWVKTIDSDHTPTQVLQGSNRRALWRCDEHDYEWEAPFSVRSSGSVCQRCKTPGIDITHPEVAAYWHPEKNLPATVSDVTHASERVFWWQCPMGHEYQRKTKKMTMYISKCHLCTGVTPSANKNSLASEYPEIAATWVKPIGHDGTPETVSRKSCKKALWRVEECGHEWIMAVERRVGGSKCTVCIGKAIMVGVNDLATTHPQLAAEWHPTRNKKAPTETTSGAAFDAWWICNAGHEYQARVYSRAGTEGTIKGGCGYCSGRYAISGVNDLATVNPELAAEWVETLNKANTPPSELLPKSNHRARWRGTDCGHEWVTNVANRTVGKGCPTCVGHVAVTE